ncbi:hypothetical protein [Aureliella helgolandensis]|uniref:Uncharacterized protein n=1 Tax=Aureliella helgolandensis TaxID=2527968 RepID=A0A518GDR1_9BACT|nr:hypothetical protein [Aureliella helgolandensis]QDV26744.1 hypothetical protein Q31a_51230 [Aureliella helgolandensis]
MSNLQKKTEAKLAEPKTLNESTILSGADILAADKLRAVPVVTHEWKPGSQVYVAELTADERDELEQSWAEYKTARDEEDGIGFRAWCAAYCICDEKRNRTFIGRQVEAAETIGKRRGKTTSRIFNTAARINGLTKADIDELEKN